MRFFYHDFWYTFYFRKLSLFYYLSLTPDHILEDKSLQLLGDLDYEVDMEPKESRLEVKFAIGA